MKDGVHKEELVRDLRRTREEIARLQMREIQITQDLGDEHEELPESLIWFIYVGEGKPVFWMPGLLPLIPPDQLLHKPIATTEDSQIDFSWINPFFHPDDVSTLLEACEAFAKGEKMVVRRKCRLHLEGFVTLWGDFYLTATERDQSGSPIAWLLCFRTIGQPVGLGSYLRQAGIHYVELLDSIRAEDSPLFNLLGPAKDEMSDSGATKSRMSWLAVALVWAEALPRTHRWDFSFIKDPSMRYVWVSASFAKLLGLRPDEIQGRTDSQLFRFQKEDEEARLAEAVMAGAHGYIRRSRSAGGKRLHFRDLLLAVPENKHGEPYWIVGASSLVDSLERETEADSKSASMLAVYEKCRQVARIDSTVLLTGETGTGKDYLARYIHEHSSREDGLLVLVDCAAIQETLLETELFGYEPGSHSTAAKLKRGRLEFIDGGTLLLDEIGELSPIAQAKLLTYLDTKSFTRVGGVDPIHTNIRILAATKRNLEEEVMLGRFRDDLFYRLNVHRIHIPPLRERLEDLPMLIEKLLPEISKKLGFERVAKLNRTQMRSLARYDWPGNVRELISVLERGLLSSSGRKFVLEEALPQLVSRKDAGREQRPRGHDGKDDWILPVSFCRGEATQDLLELAERQLVQEALRRAGGNESLAARLLGVGRGKVRKAIERHGIIGPNEPRMA